jgi:hypothetical protein
MAVHLSGNLVALRADEQFAPNIPIFNVFVLYIEVRLGKAAILVDMRFVRLFCADQ